ncbi:LPS assembly lipoprotein LptE [Glaesserella parasuis]|uniref:LPS-assembly lipoprotein LptE n=1 Tax=Glaesserella parasuis TaxID=738 RepID=UPI002436F7AE|nr:LPS assembly lipoprotein LptE [Glaesserella parasuis]MDG6874789.1 LPS assembly lipoprotein LptE [Glaesserella parasuis]
MLKKLSLICVLFLTACGWHFKNNEQFPEELRTLSFESADQYSDMSRILRNKMLLSNIQIVPKSTNVANLRLNATESSSRVASVFKQAREAEKILSLTVKATVTIPNKGAYPIETSVHRTFFDDSRAALAKSEEQESIQRQMYEQASRQLLIKVAGLQKELANTK